MKLKLAALLVLVMTACRQQPAETGDAPAATNVGLAANDTVANGDLGANEVTTTARPTDRKVLEEPKGTIDPKSTEAAGQVVQHYGALIEQGRLIEAAAYWGDRNLAAAFAQDLRSRGLKHVEISDLGDPEGAAGSIFVTMPVVFYRGAKRSPATVTLRRVNDVDGSTEEQRRWHIASIAWVKA